MRVCLGGTFDPFHAGHEALLRRAADAAGPDGSLFVGITTEALAKRPERYVGDWRERAEAVREFLDQVGFGGEVTTRALADAMGPAATDDFDAIAVSAETVQGAKRINEARQEGGIQPLQVLLVPHVVAQDLLPISSTRLHAGDIDRDGKRLTPVRVSVGSGNPVKVDAVRQEMGRVLPGLDLEVQGHTIRSGVPEQPRDGETLTGARNRAFGAMGAWREADYAVGVEAGMNQGPDGTAWFDAQVCVVQDRLGHTTVGWGPAFQYPDWVTARTLRGEMVSDILGPVADDDRIGSTTGAIGYLTDGRMDRTELTRIAVLMAFVPRIRSGLYALAPGDAATGQE